MKILILNLPGMPLMDSYLREVGVYQVINYLEDRSDVFYRYLDLNTYYLPSYQDIPDNYYQELGCDGRKIYTTIENLLSGLEAQLLGYDGVFLNVFRTAQFTGIDNLVGFFQKNNTSIVGMGRVTNYGSFMWPNLSTVKMRHPELYYVDDMNFPEGGFVGLMNSWCKTSIAPPTLSDLRIRRPYKFDNNLFLSYELSRGCINDCFYCANSLGKMQVRPYQENLEDLRWLMESTGLRKIIFVHSQINSAHIKGQLMPLLSTIIAEKWDIRWTSYLIANGNFSPWDYRIFYESGCRLLSIGVESFVEKFLQMIGKAKLPTIIRTLYAIRQTEIQTYIHLIYGFPGETLTDVGINLRRMLHLRDYLVAVNLSRLEIPFNRITRNHSVVDADRIDPGASYNPLIGGDEKESLDRTILGTYIHELTIAGIHFRTEFENFNSGTIEIYLSAMQDA